MVSKQINKFFFIIVGIFLTSAYNCKHNNNGIIKIKNSKNNTDQLKSYFFAISDQNFYHINNAKYLGIRKACFVLILIKNTDNKAKFIPYYNRTWLNDYQNYNFLIPSNIKYFNNSKLVMTDIPNFSKKIKFKKLEPNQFEIFYTYINIGKNDFNKDFTFIDSIEMPLNYNLKEKNNNIRDTIIEQFIHVGINEINW